jgi:putative ABC transport system permease protein
MKDETGRPPRWAENLLEAFCDPTIREDLMGDLHERFILRTRSMSMFRARLLYIWDVLRFMRPYTMRNDGNAPLLFMIPAYFRSSKRSLLKDPLHSLMTIGGLSLSIVAFVLIAFYVDDELKYDRHYDKAERIYRITTEINSSTATTPVVGTDGHLGQRLKDGCPEVEETVAMVKVPGKTIITYDTKSFMEDRIYKAEHTYFTIFSHPWIAGNPASALNLPKSIVLTRTLAHRYFGDQPPLNKIITVGSQEFTVTGVIEDLPPHTDMKFDALLSTDHQYLVETDYWCITFILARNRINQSDFQQKLDVLSKQYLQNEVSDTDASMRYAIERLPEVHFGTAKLFDTPKSSRNNIYIFSVIAFFILLIACINYANLAVAKALRKTTEAGIRKILGARPSQLMVQNLCESIILCCISVFIAGVAVWFLFPYFAVLTNKGIRLPEVISWRILLIVFSLLTFTCIFSALYPALTWAMIASTLVVGKSNTTVRKSGVRDALIIVQFTISIGLMICTKVVYDQWKLMSQNNPGFDKEQVMVADLPNAEEISLAGIKDALKDVSLVKSVSFVGYNSLPTSSMDIDGYEVDVEGENVSRIFNNITVDENYINLLKIELVQGRNFSPEDIENDEDYILVNESLVRAMGWENPLQQTLYSYSTAYEIIGVVRDFHFNSLHKKIEPVIIHGNVEHAEKVIIKVEKTDVQSIIELENLWKKTTATTLHFEFLDYYFNEQYKNEQTMQRVLVCFSILTIIIASLGLSGLVALSTIRKAREFAIRKILGAEFTGIAGLVFREFSHVILISICIAVPTSLFVIAQWLGQFSYQTRLGIMDCILPVVLALIITLVSISYFVIRAASANPASTLKKITE